MSRRKFASGWPLQETCHWIRKRVGGDWIGSVADRHLLVDGVSTDTRKPMPNRCLFPLSGPARWTRFFDKAVKQGAAAALWQRIIPSRNPAHSPHPGGRHPEGPAGAGCGGSPAVGDSGGRGHRSNGKTTTKELIASISFPGTGYIRPKGI